MWKLLIFLLLLQIASSEVAVPHGRKLKRENYIYSEPNSLGLMNKTQDEVNALGKDVHDFLKFLRNAKKKVVYDKKLESTDNIFYDIDVKKVAALGIISFASKPTKTKSYVVDFEQFQKTHFGQYLPCSKSPTLFVPRLFNIYNDDVEHFFITSTPNETFFYNPTTLVAVTGTTHDDCAAPEVFVPKSNMMPHDATRILKTLSEDYIKKL